MTNQKLDQSKIANAVVRLERNLPIRSRQTQLPADLRQLHQWILRFYLENGIAPDANHSHPAKDWASAVERLAAENIIVLNNNGDITGAYPFVSEERDFKIITQHGMAYAMCAFDALAVSSMFNLPTRIESCCHLSKTSISIEQSDDNIKVVEPRASVYAAINWAAAAGASHCSTTLCCEMFFIARKDNAMQWRNEISNSGELFELGDAHAFISAVFVPLMR